MILYPKELTAARICDHFWIVVIKCGKIFILKLCQHWNLKFKYALSLNRNALNDCVYITSSSDQW